MTMKLWFRIFLLTFVLTAVVMAGSLAGILYSAYQETISREYERGLDEHRIILDTLSSHLESVERTLGNDLILMPDVLEDGVVSYGNLYTGKEAALRISDSAGNSIFSSMAENDENAMQLNVAEASPRVFVLRSVGDRLLLYVNGVLQRDGTFLQVGYVRDVSAARSNSRNCMEDDLDCVCCAACQRRRVVFPDWTGAAPADGFGKAGSVHRGRRLRAARLDRAQ
jgi:hypothetical protein